MGVGRWLTVATIIAYNCVHWKFGLGSVGWGFCPHSEGIQLSAELIQREGSTRLPSCAWHFNRAREKLGSAGSVEQRIHPWCLQCSSQTSQVPKECSSRQETTVSLLRPNSLTETVTFLLYSVDQRSPQAALIQRQGAKIPLLNGRNRKGFAVINSLQGLEAH